jgi:AraC-like DNA-binding protein
MRKDMGQGISRGLGRLCVDRSREGQGVGKQPVEKQAGEKQAGEKQADGAFISDAIISAPAFPGIERIEAQFFGDVFEPHRHDTYALGVTMQGVQTFHYRGERRFSLPGNIIVLHPDEVHDGGAATDAGLRYRMLYLEPSLLQQHLKANHAALPFVAEPVLTDASLQKVLLEALASLGDGLDDLYVDGLVTEIALGLARHSGEPLKALGAPAWRQACLARDYLEANADRLVRSGELEQVSGLDRYALSRHFRALFATSPHRFLMMRRLQRARSLIEAGQPLAEIAATVGFTDQSHLNRHFKKAFGLTPGRWAALVGIKPE